MEVEGITADGYLSEAMEGPDMINQEPIKKCAGSDATAAAPISGANGCFDCNICLDFAVDPVVTLCGHLYCWPCIYKWLQVESATPQQCPVCKASLTESTLVPLYGRGRSHTTKRSHQSQSLDIPHRPSSIHRRAPQSPRSNDTEEEEDEEEEYYTDLNPSPIHHRRRHHRHQHYHLHQHEHHHHYPYYGYGYAGGEYMSSSPSASLPSSMHLTAGGVLGGMAIAVLPWVFRNQHHQQEAAAAASTYYTRPYQVAANGGSPRLRRQEMEVERSLHQIWLFFFCCAVLCLLLF